MWQTEDPVVLVCVTGRVVLFRDGTVYKLGTQTGSVDLLGGEARYATARPIWWLAGAALAIGIAGVLALPVDGQLSGLLQPDALPGDLRRAITLSEAFAHGTGAAVILIAIALSVTPSRRPAVWMAIWVTLASGLAANGLKAAFVRVRPHSVGKIEIEESSWLASSEAKSESPETIEDKAEEAEPDFWDSRQRSFPSGHSATAWGLAIGLSLAFPRSAAVFLLLALLASIQRISSGAHFPSDVFAGAVIACVTAIAILIVSRPRGASLMRSSALEEPSAVDGRT